MSMGSSGVAVHRRDRALAEHWTVHHPQIIQTQQIDRREAPLPFIGQRRIPMGVREPRHARQVEAENVTFID